MTNTTWMSHSVSYTFLPQKQRKGAFAALLLLIATVLLAGCFGATPYVPTKDDDDLFKAKGVDKALYEAVCKGEKDPFVIIAVFKKDVFLSHSAVLDKHFIPVLSEFGNVALLLVRPTEVLPLLKDPSLTRASWFGPQGLLARLDPSLEFDMLKSFGKGAESGQIIILARFRSVPESSEEKAMTTAGFNILSKAGPTFIISGPMSGIPKLLSHEWIAYLEKGNLP